MQHADHFTRILNERESYKRDKFSDVKSENNSDTAEENSENSEQKFTKELEVPSGDEVEVKVEKSAKSQVEIN